MNVLVTGGAGFIGSHLCEQLLAAGERVRVIDNLSTGKRSNLPGHPALEFLEGDIREEEAVMDAVRGMDAVVHLAAVASVQASVAQPVETHRTNLDGTLHLLEAARRNGVHRFVYASSAAVYGDADAIPTSEDSTPNPLTPYATDKLAGEYYLRFYHRQYGLETTAFRFFNVYGPRQEPSSPYSGVISIFVDRIRRGAPVTIFGDGRQTRDFVYVGDLAVLLARSLRQATLAGQVVNVGHGIESSLLDLLDVFERLNGGVIARHHEAPRFGDIVRSCADTAKLRRLAGAMPATDIRVGLEKLLQYELARASA